MFLKIFLFLLSAQITVISCLQFDRCTLANQLLHAYRFPRHQISTWICIIEHESFFNTGAVNLGSNDYGLFQISSRYWCDRPFGQGCNIPCWKFLDDNIYDDVQCAKQIFNEFVRIKNNGFKAWISYDLYCRGNNEGYIQFCAL